MSDEVDKLILEAWRREADHAQKRLERLEDQLATVVTLSLGTAVLGVGAVGYVANYKGQVLDFMTIAGVLLLGIAGAVSIGARVHVRSPERSHGSAPPTLPAAPGADVDAKTALRDLAKLEQERMTHAYTRGLIARQHLIRALVVYLLGSS